MENDLTQDPFEEYIREAETSKQETAYYWQTAIGLQAVDDAIVPFSTEIDHKRGV